MASSTEENDLKAIRTLPWSGKEEDWQMWSQKFIMRGMLKGYLKIMDGSVSAPDQSIDIDNLVHEDGTNATEDEKEAARKARKLNNDGYVDLIFAMQDVKSFNLVQENEGMLYGAWTALKDEFEPSTGSDIVRLTKEFANSKLENAKLDIVEWLTDLEHKRQRLKLAGKVIEDLDFMTHVLANLPKEYLEISSRLERDLGKKILTVKEMRSELKIHYIKMKEVNNWTENEIALAATTNNSSSRFTKQFKGRCRNCGRLGHKSANCWEREENKNKRPKNWQPSSGSTQSNSNSNQNRTTGRCWNCGERGHVQMNCPKKEQANRANQSTQEHVLLAVEPLEDKNLVGSTPKGVLKMSKENDNQTDVLSCCYGDDNFWDEFGTSNGSIEGFVDGSEVGSFDGSDESLSVVGSKEGPSFVSCFEQIVNQEICGIEKATEENATDDDMNEIDSLHGIDDDIDTNERIGGIEGENNETPNQEEEVERKNVEKEHMDASQQSSENVALLMHDKLKFEALTEEIWIGDSGASCHTTNSKRGMYDLEELNAHVTIGDGRDIAITHKGKIDVLI